MLLMLRKRTLSDWISSGDLAHVKSGVPDQVWLPRGNGMPFFATPVRLY